ncbi:gibberellin-regulated protein 12 [Cryptomeria japonica]|uniref:gibberellin-regulated protein 12 n=1 Tax=Cryptomeria japonica TaxID=3369 RepID=UPI0025AB6741|nr:gibberellin-regulated protein 12 [Cryptomeria japonica]
MMARTFYAALLIFLVFAVIAAEFSQAFSHDERILLQTRRKHKHTGFKQGECPGACSYRCSKTQHRKPCMFFCQKCCFKCRCVPPGTYGHKEVCPCYNNWKTQEGKPKCP